MAGILDLMGHVQQQGQLGRERGQQTRLGQLAGQSYTAPQDQRAGILSQMASISPQAAQSQQQQFRAGDTDRVAQLSQKAKLFVGMAKSGNQQAIAGMYPEIAREARELFGTNVPDAYDPSFLPGIEQFAALGDRQQASGVQSTYIDDRGQRIAILRDGSTQVLGNNAPNNQIIDTGNGFFGVNKGNLQAAPVQVGGATQQQAPQPGMYQTPQGIVRLGDDLSPEQREAAMADAAQGGTAQNVSLPARNASPQQYGGGEQLRSAPKPQAPTELERRMALAQGMNASPEELRALVMGNASTKGPSAAEQKDALARKAKQPQVANAVRGLGRIEQALKGLSGGLVNTGPLDQYATRYTKAGQELEAAVGGIQNSLLSLTRVPGIGSQSDLEARIAGMQYPSLEKDPEVNKRTVENLRAFIADLQQAYQLADAPVSGDTKPSSGVAPAAPGGWSIQRVD